MANSSAIIFDMVDGSSDGSSNGPILAHQMPLAGAVHHITEIPPALKKVVHRADGTAAMPKGWPGDYDDPAGAGGGSPRKIP
jgi:hypothetical protein